jgi:hypothetical protein
VEQFSVLVGREAWWAWGGCLTQFVGGAGTQGTRSRQMSTEKEEQAEIECDQLLSLSLQHDQNLYRQSKKYWQIMTLISVFVQIVTKPFLFFEPTRRACIRPSFF